MHSQLVDSTNGWFLWPSSPDRPSNDRLWVFITLVALLGKNDGSGEFSRNVHRYFTYLLLGYNPVTREIKPSSFNDDVTEDPIFTDDLNRTFVDLLNFESEDCRMSSKYSLYVKFLEISNVFGSVVLTETIGEQRTLLLLSLVLCVFDSIRPPSDLVSIQACLNLYHKHISVDISTPQIEYSNEIGLMYTAWMRKNVERVFSIGNLSTNEIFSGLGYMAWFSSLIKAKRILTAIGDDREFSGQYVRKLLKDQVDLLFNIIDTYPLVAVDSEKNFTCNRFLNVLGIKPKKKLKGI